MVHHAEEQELARDLGNAGGACKANGGSSGSSSSSSGVVGGAKRVGAVDFGLASPINSHPARSVVGWWRFSSAQNGMMKFSMRSLNTNGEVQPATRIAKSRIGSGGQGVRLRD
ncbi:unnamed protein product [Ectocarpus sp. 12 AP-2014]